MNRATRQELGALALALAIVIALFLFLTDGGVLFTRPLWTDELHTVLLASRPTPFAIVSDLANGADYAPPLLHVTTWLVRVLVGGTLTPTILRVSALLCVCGALLVVYVVLRRRFDAISSAAGMFAVASHELVVAHSFEARFYGPWLLCAALFAASLSLAEGRRRSVAMAIAAILLATVHWYGIVSLATMVAAVVASDGSRWRGGVRTVAPAAAGVLAFALCVPLAMGQRHALTVNTWVPAFRLSQVESLARLYWTGLIPVVAMVVLIVGLVVRLRRPAQRLDGDITVGLSDDSVVALISLAVMPLALAAMSIAGQPSMWPRYGIPAVLAWAPLVAFAMSLAGRWSARAFIALAVFVWFMNFTKESRYKRSFAIGVGRQLDAVRKAESLGVPIVFQSMHAMYAVASADWGNRTKTSLLELPDSTINAILPRGGRFEALNKALRVERDVARVHSRRFGFPRLSAQQALDSLPRFLLVASDDNMPPGYSGVEGIAVAVFPRHRLARLAPGLLLFDRSSTPVPGDAKPSG